MKLYSGILTAIIGAIVLILSYFLGGVDNNWIQFFATLLIIAGIVIHIRVNYKKPNYNEAK